MEDYEQKHKEDLEEAKSWLAIAKENNDKIAIQILEKFFPELKKSEEEIMKEVIYNLIVSNDCTASSKEIFSIYGKTKEDCVAWLEKQGESKFKQCIQEGDKIVTNEDGTHFNVSQLERVSQKVTETEESAKKFLKSAEIMDENGKLADEYRLEKQDEQKPNDEDTIQSYSFYSYKGEPDFKVGDWIINPKTGNILQIKNVLLCGNKGNYEFGNNSMPIESVDRYYKRWTIQDAKDGDVLSFNDGHGNDSIELIKSVTDKKIEFWFCLTNGNRYEVFDGIIPYTNFASRESATPATKEQRDFLFQKMKESGYMWDVEKKELKKISQEYPLTPNECCKPAWSEEDENMLQKAISTIRYALSIPADKDDDPCFAGTSTIDWLKSLKDRVQPQSNQEWGEYDKIQLSEAIQMIEANGTWIRSEDAVKKVSNWLKPLKPQNTWKPSKAQLRVLQTAIKDYGICVEKNVLESLYNDLKKF